METTIVNKEQYNSKRRLSWQLHVSISSITCDHACHAMQEALYLSTIILKSIKIMC